jgi:hypothetical protein
MEKVDMYDFFYDELKMLRALTGIRQWENLNELPDPKKAINDLIDLMIKETNVEPYDIISPKVKQRVIHDAILNDPEFIGLNAKFVRKALHTFWMLHGENILFKHNEQKRKDEGPVVLKDPEAVDVLLKSYLNRLRKTAPPPKIENPQKEGKEWQSELERKAVSTQIDPDRKPYTEESIKERNAKIRGMQEKAFRERNPGASEEDVQLFLQSVKKYEIPEV